MVRLKLKSLIYENCKQIAEIAEQKKRKLMSTSAETIKK